MPDKTTANRVRLKRIPKGSIQVMQVNVMFVPPHGMAVEVEIEEDMPVMALEQRRQLAELITAAIIAGPDNDGDGGGFEKPLDFDEADNKVN